MLPVRLLPSIVYDVYYLKLHAMQVGFRCQLNGRYHCAARGVELHSASSSSVGGDLSLSPTLSHVTMQQYDDASFHFALSCQPG